MSKSISDQQQLITNIKSYTTTHCYPVSIFYIYCNMIVSIMGSHTT